MKKMFLLFSHTLTNEQENQAIKEFQIETFVSLPKKLQDIWSNLSSYKISIKDDLEDIKYFLQKTSFKGDIVLIQGDFGAVYEMVNFSKSINLIPIYATTKRVVEEFIEDDKIIKKSIFKHGRFRKYE